MILSKKKKVVIITGPTASGKTDLIGALFKHSGGGSGLLSSAVVVNADSKQFYRSLPILTAQPFSCDALRYHLVDFLELGAEYSAYTFGQEVRELFSSIKYVGEKKRVFFLAGGSPFYLKSIFQSLPLNSIAEQQKIKENRLELEREYRAHGLSRLLEELRQKDHAYFQIVDRANPRRVLRALEVIRCKSGTFTAYRRQKKALEDFEVLQFILWPLRKKLWENIALRADRMFCSGVVLEVEKFLATHRCAEEKLAGSGIIGAKEIVAFLKGGITKAQACEQIIIRTRQFAKRQKTWFKKEVVGSIFLVPEYCKKDELGYDDWLMQDSGGERGKEVKFFRVLEEMQEYVYNRIQQFYT